MVHSFAMLCGGIRSPTAPAFCQHLCSKERLHGMCAAHWAALQTAVQLAGGASSCDDALPHIITDLHAICDTCGALLTDASLLALFSDVAVQLGPSFAKVRLSLRFVSLLYTDAW